MNEKRHVLFLDLKDDPKLIAEYEKHHRDVWPEVIESIRTKGIEEMQIFRAGNRLAMIIHVNESFSVDAPEVENKVVSEWERLMWNYQQPLPFAKAGEKWVRGEAIFSLNG